ncbi:hypothetical protein BST36_30865, partial [Mycolicibacterium moriokaense]
LGGITALLAESTLAEMPDGSALQLAFGLQQHLAQTVEGGLFGYDATAGVMADWMYERLSAEYVLDDENRKFMAESNPWALH